VEALRRPWLALGCAAALGACAKPALSPRPSGLAPVQAVQAVPTPRPTPGYPQSKPVDEAQPLKVRSRRLKVGQAGAETVFYGGVTVTQDTTVLTARELRSHDQGRNAVASGDVRLLDPQRKVEALADEADYGDALRQATLHGKVRLLSVDPYGVGVTMTGASATYGALSRSASAQGGVTIYRGRLTATADSADMADGGAFVHLSGGVEAQMGPDQATAQEADLESEDRSMTLKGSVRARFIPSDMRKAAADPADVR
jgi:lipopolysaccharide export system protein LptA